MKSIVWIVILIILTGCIINPIYFKKDLIQLPEIIGNWDLVSEQGKNNRLAQTWEISEHSEKKYLIDMKQGQTGFHLASFLQLDGRIYADVVGYLPSLSNHEEQIHNVYKIDMENDTFRATGLDLDYLEKGIKSSKYKLSHRIDIDKLSGHSTDKTLIITASTEELQKFIIENQNDTILFPIKKQLIFKKIEPTFFSYFPKDSWNLDEIKKELIGKGKFIDYSNKTINELKIDSNYNRFIKPIIKDFELSSLKYKPFYFFQIINLIRNGINKSDMNEMCYDYTLNRTTEFFHFFINQSYANERAMMLWASAINAEFQMEHDKIEFVKSIKKNCMTSEEHTKRLSSFFITFFKEDKH